MFAIVDGFSKNLQPGSTTLRDTYHVQVCEILLKAERLKSHTADPPCPDAP